MEFQTWVSRTQEPEAAAVFRGSQGQRCTFFGFLLPNSLPSRPPRGEDLGGLHWRLCSPLPLKASESRGAGCGPCPTRAGLGRVDSLHSTSAPDEATGEVKLDRPGLRARSGAKTAARPGFRKSSEAHFQMCRRAPGTRLSRGKPAPSVVQAGSTAPARGKEVWGSGGWSEEGVLQGCGAARACGSPGAGWEMTVPGS